VLVDDEIYDVRRTLANRLSALSKAAYVETLKDLADFEKTGYEQWQRQRYENERELIAAERWEKIAEDPKDIDSAIEVLAYMCGERLRPLTPHAWNDLDSDEREQIAASSLVLFDRELGEGVEPGDELLADFLQECPQAAAAILTSKVHAGEEIDDALQNAHSHAIGSVASDPARSLTAIKERLMNTPVEFVEDLRVTRAAPVLKGARDRVIEVAAAAHAAALEEVKTQIDLRTLEHIMVRVARDEGSWEADALLRVLAIAYRSQAQALLLDEDTLRELTQLFEKLRQLFSPRDAPFPPAKAKTTNLMSRECYDPGALINPAGLPICCGDLFELRGGDEVEARLWMLLEQPCDLQLRDTSDSREAIAFTDLIAVCSGKPTKPRSYELPSRSGESELQEELHLMLNQRLTVSLDVLELCVFDEGGACRIDSAAEEPSMIAQTPALARRWVELLGVHKRTAELARLTNDRQIRDRIIASGGALTGDSVLEWPIRRVARLNEPYAQPALRAACDDRSRFAFDPDLTAN
jgi:hypothetical protein